MRNYKKYLVLGNGSSISSDAIVDAHKAPIIIGENTHILKGAFVDSHNHHWDDIDWVDKGEIGIAKNIGNNVIIGMRAIILPTCKNIGDNAIIGAGSVVAKDIPKNEIWAGNPARFIRLRK
jgi:hypothetical protein